MCLLPENSRDTPFGFDNLEIISYPDKQSPWNSGAKVMLLAWIEE